MFMGRIADNKMGIYKETGAMRQIKKVLFPFGIFILLALIFAGGAVAASAGYYYVTLKRDIAETERNTQQYLIPLLDACVQMASMDGGAKSAERMNELFNGYRSTGIVFKAFFVKEDGSILAHSSSDEVKSLKSNIASDEFTYNLDQIFLPLKRDIKEPLFSDYYIVDKNVPFTKEQMMYLKKYINSGLDRNGWILSRKVSYKDKSAGVIVFLVDKGSMYEAIILGFNQAVFRTKIAGGAGLGLALLLSLIIFLRYKMIYSRAFRDSIPAARSAFDDGNRDIALSGDAPSAPAARASLTDATAEFLDTEHPKVYVECEVDKRNIPEQRTLVLDAIPVRKKMQ